MSSRIKETMDKLHTSMECNGKKFKDTLELIGVAVTIDLDEVSSKQETAYVTKLIGDEKFLKKLAQEQTHYLQLRYSILHKIEETMFFFPNESEESRKNIIFSNDCISSIQYLKRGDTADWMVHMRSSNLDELLPVDILALIGITQFVNEIYPVKHTFMNLTIGSLHTYIGGDPRRC